MKHIFLTGQIQIGKSTAIQKTMQLLNLQYGGFRTYFSDDRGDPNQSLYIGDAAQPYMFDEEHVVARISSASPPQILSERFDTLGVRYIEEAMQNAPLIIMDECGSLENQALQFQRAVLGAIDGNTPSLGVLKHSATGWVDKIRRHPDVVIITVDEHNRNALPRFLAQVLS